MVDISAIEDLSNEMHNEYSKYLIQFALVPNALMTEDYIIESLNWDSVKYGDEEKNRVPDDRRGIYAFCIQYSSAVLPGHGYVLYIGIAGRDSYRSLRERYQDYLTVSKIKNRKNIVRMIGDWHEILRFFYAPVGDDVSNEDLKLIERQLNTALQPPLSINDIEANVRQRRNAFP